MLSSFKKGTGRYIVALAIVVVPILVLFKKPAKIVLPSVWSGETFHNFGLLDSTNSEVTVHHTFVLKNVSKNPIIVVKSIVDCSCMAVEIENQKIDPGQCLRVTLQLASTKKPLYSATGEPKISTFNVVIQTEQGGVVKLTRQTHWTDQFSIVPKVLKIKGCVGCNLQREVKISGRLANEFVEVVHPEGWDVQPNLPTICSDSQWRNV